MSAHEVGVQVNLKDVGDPQPHLLCGVDVDLHVARESFGTRLGPAKRYEEWKPPDKELLHIHYAFLSVAYRGGGQSTHRLQLTSDTYQRPRLTMPSSRQVWLALRPTHGAC